MTLDPRGLALQGIGFSALLVALQGLSPVIELAPPPVTGPSAGTPTRHFIRPTRREEDEEILLLVAMALQTLELS